MKSSYHERCCRETVHVCKYYSSWSYHMVSSIILSSFYWSPSSPPQVTCSNRRSDLRIGVKISEYHWHCDHLCGISYNSTFVCEVVGSHQFAVGPFHRQPCCIASIVACRVRRLLNGVNIELLYLEYWTWGCWCLSFMYRWIRLVRLGWKGDYFIVTFEEYLCIRCFHVSFGIWW